MSQLDGLKLEYVGPSGLHTGFFRRGGKFSKTIYTCMLHVKAAHKTLPFTIYMYMYAISDPKILGGGGGGRSS